MSRVEPAVVAAVKSGTRLLAPPGGGGDGGLVPSGWPISREDSLTLSGSVGMMTGMDAATITPESTASSPAKRNSSGLAAPASLTVSSDSLYQPKLHSQQPATQQQRDQQQRDQQLHPGVPRHPDSAGSSAGGGESGGDDAAAAAAATASHGLGSGLAQNHLLGAPDAEVTRSLAATHSSAVSFNVDISLPGSPTGSPTNAARASRGGSSGSDAYVDVVNRRIRREGSGTLTAGEDGAMGTMEDMRRANEELRGMMSRAFDKRYTVVHFVLDIKFRYCGADLPGFALRWSTSRELIGTVETERASGRRVVGSAQWVFLEPNDDPIQVEMRSRDDDDIDGMVSLDSAVWDEVVFGVNIFLGENDAAVEGAQVALSGKRSREALVQLQREEDYLETGTGSRIDIRRDAALGDKGLDEASVRLFFHPNFVRSNGLRVDVFKDVEFVASVQDFPFATVAEDSEGWSRLVVRDENL
jgi:hypothetical protein